MPQLKTVRRIHRRDHTDKLKVINGIPTVRLWANDTALKAIASKVFIYESPNYFKETWTTENTLIVHDKLFCTWDGAADRTFAESFHYNDHLKNNMAYAVRRIGPRDTVSGPMGPRLSQYVDVELEPAPAFAGSYEEVEADMAKE